MWVEEKKLIASDPTNSKHLGHHAAVGDDVVLVGTNPTGEQDDSAYVYTLPPPPCHTFAECADADGDAIRDDNCVWWSCDCGVCSGTDLVFADMGGAFGDCLPDHTVDGNDRFHALNCFSNQGVTPGSPYPCEPGPPASTNVDAGGPFRACCPDGVCDANDAMQALHTFSDENPCTCPANFACPCPIPTAGICLGNGQSCTSDDDCGGGDCHLVMCPLGPQPEAPSGSPIDWPRVVDRSAVRLVGDRSEAAPGDLIDVDVYLKDAVADLQGYQLHVEAAGGKRGALELVDVAIDERREHVFAGLAGWRAFNVHTRQMLAGLDSPGVATRPGAYLATFTFQASPDAAGTFSVELLHDNRDPAQRTFIFPTPPGAKIEVESAAAAVVIIREKPALSRLSRTSWKAPAR
jgi:hypothetical protein